MRIDELRNLDFRRIGSLSVGAKAALLCIVFLLMVVGGWWFQWSEQLDQIEREQRQEMTLRDTFREKKRMAINLDAWRKRLVEIQQGFGALLRQLPNRSEMDALLNDINQAGLGRGLQFDLFKPAAQETLADFYAELPVTLRINGRFHDVAAFASDLSRLPRIVLLQDMNISVQQRPNEKAAAAASKDVTLVMEGTARTYRYLDEQELAQQQKANKGAKK